MVMNRFLQRLSLSRLAVMTVALDAVVATVAVPRRLARSAIEWLAIRRASLHWLLHRSMPVFAIALLIASMGGTWRIASAAPSRALAALEADSEMQRPIKKSAKDLTGKVNINTATEEQLMMLPTIGPAKADRIVLWRKKNGGFKRIADLRRVKGFGYKTFKRLEPFLDIKGETTLK
jgi:competence ComEA-like helix-hairpin-helix protein